MLYEVITRIGRQHILPLIAAPLIIEATFVITSYSIHYTKLYDDPANQYATSLDRWAYTQATDIIKLGGYFRNNFV